MGSSHEHPGCGFDPRERSHELTAWKNENHNKSPKRVLAHLTASDPDRRDRCLHDLQRLHDRGAENGCRDFLDELKTHIFPAVTGQPFPR